METEALDNTVDINSLKELWFAEAKSVNGNQAYFEYDFINVPMDGKISTKHIIESVEEVTNYQPDFLDTFRQAMQQRKDELLEISMKTLGFDPFPDSYDIKNIPKGVDAIRYMVAKKVTKILLGDDFEVRQVDATANTTIVPSALTKKRKNKYGLEMTDLEQELDNIKIGLVDIENFDPYNQAGETSYEFFTRVYGKYRDAGVIYQADLLVIDNRLLKNLKDYFRYGRNKKYEGQVESLQLLLPSKHVYTRNIVSKIIDKDLTRKEISHIASSLLDKHKYL
jgi:hypothetical protein